MVVLEVVGVVLAVALLLFWALYRKRIVRSAQQWGASGKAGREGQ